MGMFLENFTHILGSLLQQWCDWLGCTAVAVTRSQVYCLLPTGQLCSSSEQSQNSTSGLQLRHLRLKTTFPLKSMEAIKLLQGNIYSIKLSILLFSPSSGRGGIKLHEHRHTVPFASIWHHLWLQKQKRTYSLFMPLKYPGPFKGPKGFFIGTVFRQLNPTSGV